MTLIDLDGDGALDVYAAGPQGQRLYHNEKGRLVDVTAAWGLDPKQGATGAVAGDYDNDERPDLLLLRRGGLALLHNDGGRFSDATAAAGIAADPRPYVSAAFVDADHDGDLDIVLAGLADPATTPPGGAAFPDGFPGATTRLLQNDGPPGSGIGTHGDALQPAWSPHGKRIAFWGMTFDTLRREIWTIDPDAADPPRTVVRVASSNGGAHWNPVWSPPRWKIRRTSGVVRKSRGNRRIPDLYFK